MAELTRILFQAALALRYRVRVVGLEAVARRGTRGILFLPNHPALIDPIILTTVLYRRFRQRAIADQDQIRVPIMGTIIRQFNVIPLPDVKVYGQAVRPQVDAAWRTAAETLRSGGNLLIYPSGHIYRTRLEDLRGNSGTEDLLRAAPDARVVLIRTTGLWGSSLSLAGGELPNLGGLLKRQAWNLLRNGLFFMPRRDVQIELHEPADLPRNADRHTLNAYLERFYNADPPPNRYVAYTFWERPRTRELPDPEWSGAAADLSTVPAATRELVLAKLREMSGVAQITPEQHLARDLGLDSLTRTDLLLWLTREFGHAQPEGDAVRTVGDALLAACGQALSARPTPLNPPPAGWARVDRRGDLKPPPGDTITQVFLGAARRDPGAVLLVDQASGGRSYRDLVTAILVLKPEIEKLPGDYVGVMLPASVGASIVYLAALFAGKTPVMVNWTTGARSIQHVLDLVGVRHVLTAGALLTRLEGQGVDFGPVRDRLLPLEQLRAGIGRPRLLAAALRARLSWAALERVTPRDEAVVLVTSGSESLPKAVPLTHANILANLRDIAGIARLQGDDRLIGFLPPFHSFGLTVTMIMPLLLGMRTVYHANPNDAFTLARLIELFGATLICGTPTFLAGVLRAAPRDDMLASLRLAVTGAEKCPERVYEALARQCPRAVVVEGYGITECSPIVAVNDPAGPRPGTIGRVLPSLDWAVVDVERQQRVAPGGAGMLLVRGPSVFGGYLGRDAADPFVEFEGHRWYRTGDLVAADAGGVLTFRGRLKRFVKIGGEMISLPAIEAALEPALARPDDEAPAFAVVALGDESRPELVLCTTRPIERAGANERIRAAGLSGLHNITRVLAIEAVPLLGNGKTDYRAVEKLVASE